MSVKSIKSIKDFFDIVAPTTFAEQRGRWVFRGHANKDFRLVPSVARSKRTSKYLIGHEKSLLEAFKREGESYTATNFDNDWEWLAFAQHHGLPTRFLDFSHNALAALFFSCIEEQDNDGMLIALHSTRKAGEATLAKSPFEIKQCIKYYPKILSPRIRAQEGLFIAFADPNKDLEDCKQPAWNLSKYVIPAISKPQLRYDLFRIGTHHSSLFPDVDGLARRVAWQHSVKPI